MPEPIDAIFENGAFRPLDLRDSHFSDGDRVRLIVNATDTDNSDAASDVLALAAQVYAGLSASDVDEVQRIATDRTSFFSAEDR